jgi:hypothetical protein
VSGFRPTTSRDAFVFSRHFRTVGTVFRAENQPNGDGPTCMTRVSTCLQASQRKVRNSGWTPNFGKVATCVIGAAQFGQLIAGDVSAPEGFITEAITPLARAPR